MTSFFDQGGRRIGKSVRFQAQQLEHAIGEAGRVGLTYAEIGERLHWPADSVKYWVGPALQESVITVAADEVSVDNPHIVTMVHLGGGDQ